MNKILRISIVAIGVFGLSASTFAQKTRKVIVIGIDGCVNSVFNQTNSPNIQGLINSGYYASNTLNIDPTLSGPNWATILTGTKPNKHGVTSNNWGPANLSTYKSFFNAIKTQYPTKRTAAIVTYADLNDGVPVAVANQIISVNDVTLKQNGTDAASRIYANSGFNTVEGDADTKNKVVAELTNNNPDAIFCHFDNMDHTGHGSGFGPSNPAYVTAIGVIDGHVGAILTAINSRANIANEDWLVVVTTDHGGSGTSHGGTSFVERNSFIILKGAGIAPQLSAITDRNLFVASSVGFTTNSFGQLPAPASIPTLNLANSFTLDFRVRRSAPGTSDPAIISNQNWSSGVNKGITIYQEANQIKISLGDGTGANRTDLSTGILLSDDKWHYVTVVINRTTNTVSVYDRGVFVKAKAFTSGAATGTFESTFPFRIAQAYNNNAGTADYTQWFNGNVTDVKIYNTALTQTAILNSVKNDNLSAATPNLVFYAKGHDASGTNYVGTVGGNVSLMGAAVPNWSNVSASIGSNASNIAPLYNTVNATIPSATAGLNLSTTGSYTIELAVKRAGSPTGTESDPAIFSNKNWSSGNNVGIAIVDRNGSVRANIGDGSNRADADGASLTDGQWHYLSIVVDRTAQMIRLYDGGILQSEQSISGVTGTALTANSFRIAQDGTGTYASTFNGSVRGVKLFNTALTAATIKLHAFNADLDNTHPNYSNLTYYLKSVEGAGATLTPSVDLGAIGNTTISATPTSWGSTSTVTNAYFVDFDNINPPYTYSIAPTVLQWLNVPIPASYDGVVLAGVTTLPVTLTSFTGLANNNSVNLKWNVSSEVNVDKYEVERSASKDNFVKVGELKATGTTSYATTDYSPLNGVNYYRLKVTDKDGTVEYKNTIAVNFGLTSGKSGLVAPNPITGSEIGVQLKQYPAGKYNYAISNTLGSIVQKGEFNYNGFDKVSIQLNQTLTKGIYLLNIDKGAEKFQSKLIVQ